MQFEAKIEQNDVSVTVEKASCTEFPKEKTGLHRGNT